MCWTLDRFSSRILIGLVFVVPVPYLHACLFIHGHQNEWYHQPSSVPPGWPSKGGIELKGLTLRYRDDLDPVIQNLTLSVHGGEKVWRSIRASRDRAPTHS